MKCPLKFLGEKNEARSLLKKVHLATNKKTYEKNEAIKVEFHNHTKRKIYLFFPYSSQLIIEKAEKSADASLDYAGKKTSILEISPGNFEIGIWNQKINNWNSLEKNTHEKNSERWETGQLKNNDVFGEVKGKIKICLKYGWTFNKKDDELKNPFYAVESDYIKIVD